MSSSSPLRARTPRLAPRLAGAAVARARLTVVPRRPPETTRVPFAILVSFVLLAGVIGLLMFNTTMQQGAFTQSALEEQNARLTAREQALQQDIRDASDPQRLADQATRLGMVPAPAPAFLSLADGSVKGVPTPASADDRLDIDPPAPALPDDYVVRKRYVDAPAPSAERTRTDRTRETDRTRGTDRTGTRRAADGDTPSRGR